MSAVKLPASLLVTFVFVLGTAPGRSETVNCSAITTLPTVISVQGVYCLTDNLDTSMTTGKAITINANNVVIDLNGFKLDGLEAGSETRAAGIYARSRQNITIKNGTVRGFYYGIWLEGIPPSPSQGNVNVVERIRADQNSYTAIKVEGTANVIRDNQVTATRGTALSANSSIHGIYAYGPMTQVLNNTVGEVSAQGVGAAFGIFLFIAPNSVVEGNRIFNITSPGGYRYGIYVGSSNPVLVRDNMITSSQFGIDFALSTGKYMNNLTEEVITPYVGGTPAGTTNY